MKGWFLLYYSPKAYQRVLTGLGRLAVEHYTPLLTVVTKRADSKTCVRISQRPLFPAYLFVCIDLEIINMTKITQIIGVNEFVKIGGKIRPVSEDVISALQSLQLEKVGNSEGCTELKGVSDKIFHKMEEINEKRDPSERMTALIIFLNEHLPSPVNI